MGISRNSDGIKLSHADRHGNNLADLMAKNGAKLYRVPARVRYNVEIAERVALRAALQLGVTTHAANNVAVSDCKPDGTTLPGSSATAAEPPEDQPRGKSGG